MLYDKGLVLAKLETTFRTDAAPTAASDALEAIDPNFSPEFTLLERDTITGDKSPKLGVMGRKLAKITFQTELKGTGSSSEGKMASLLKACGFASQSTATTNSILMDQIIPIGTPTGVAGTTSKTTAFTGTYPRRCLMECTTAGTHSTSQWTVTAPAVGNGVGGNAAFSDATANTAGVISLPQSAELTLGTPTTDFVVGDRFATFVVPTTGNRYKVIDHADNEDSQSITIHIYFDGILHKMTGCRGSFQITANAGEFGTVDWDFTGDYVTVGSSQNTPVPTGAVFETTTPPQIENASVSLPKGVNAGGGNSFGAPATIVANTFSWDCGNTIVPRTDITASDGYSGAKVSERAPTFEIDPETEDTANQDFWSYYEAGTTHDVMTGVGTTTGNMVYMFAPRAQCTGISYANRDATRVSSFSANLVRNEGEDEFVLWIG
jgi:hypothetical protein